MTTSTRSRIESADIDQLVEMAAKAWPADRVARVGDYIYIWAGFDVHKYSPGHVRQFLLKGKR